MKKRWFSLLSIGVLSFFLMGATQNDKSYSAAQFDVDVLIEEGGSLLVTETVLYDFTGGPFTFIFRELPTDHTDGIVDIAATFNGRSLSQGEDAGQVEISGEDPIRITWHFEPTVDTRHTVTLTYRVLGVARREDGVDAVYWQALPDEYDFTIGQSTTTITYPAGLELLGGVDVRAGSPEVSQRGNQVTFTSENLQPDDPLVVALRFPGSALINTQPEWQARAEAQSQQAPYWIGTAVFLFIIGLVAVVAQAGQDSTPTVDRKGMVYEPPGKLSPGIAGTLIAPNATANWSTALGSLFDLAEQGVVEIDESPEKKWYRSHDFLIRLLERPSGLEQHETALLDLLFTNKQGQTKTVKFSEMSKLVSSRRWKTYTELVKSDMKMANFLNPQRNQRRKRFIAIGVMGLFLGLVLVAMFAIMSRTVGPAPVALGFSVMGIGLIALIAGATITPLTNESIVQAAEWQRFSNYIKRVAKGKESISGPQMFIKYLPYAATFGLLQPWAKHFEREGWEELPPYFNALPGSNPGQSMAAFVAMSSATASSGGAAAGAAGAGAAGGGAAGAG